MLDSSSSAEYGKRLRAERERLRLSLRDVQGLSREIAKKRQNPDYYVAHASLADIENGKLAPTIYKLYSLSVIYGHRYDELAAFSGIPINEADKDHSALIFPRTYLVGSAPEDSDRAIFSPLELREKLRTERTDLLPKILERWKEIPTFLLQQMDWRNSLYGYIGMEDDTLYPYVRPGSFVQIDSRQRKIPAVDWHSDFDRPIFFVELRDRYVCSWCELHGGQLILIPAQQSQRRAEHVRYPVDATIVGRVTAVSMRIVGAGSGGRQ